MKISIHTTITNANIYQYPWREAIRSYLVFADEVVVVDGESIDGTLEELLEWAKKEKKLKIVRYYWPQDNWKSTELTKHLNRGFMECSGNICIKADIDYILHEKDFAELKEGLEKFYSQNLFNTAALMKKIILNCHTYYKKCRLPFVINKTKSGMSILYGRATDKKNDDCYPVIVDKFVGEIPVPYGRSIDAVYNIGVCFYCYDHFFRNIKVAKERIWRFAQAFPQLDWGKTEKESWEKFLRLEMSRLGFDITHKMGLEDHPSFIKDRVKKMSKDEFGYDNWGLPESFEQLIK